MKDPRYQPPFFEQVELQQHPQPEPTDHEKLMEAFRRLNDKCDEAIQRIRKRNDA